MHDRPPRSRPSKVFARRPLGRLAFGATLALLALGGPPPGLAQSATGSAVRPFDVNDLAILFPLRDGLPYPAIRASDANGFAGGKATGEIWPRRLFDQVTAHALGSTGRVTMPDGTRHQIGLSEAMLRRENWRIVGLRFMPCAFTRKMISETPIPRFPAGCIPMVRLVAQPFVDGKDLDVAAHLVYVLHSFAPELSFDDFLTQSFSEKETTPMAAAFGLLLEIQKRTREAKVSTAGAPMGPHPGLSSELDGDPSETGPIGAAVVRLVRALTGPRGMSNISFMGLPADAGQPWIFFGGELKPFPGGRGGDFDLTTVSFEPKNQPRSAVLLDLGAQPGIHPRPELPSTAPLFGSAADADRTLTMRIDNPEVTHNFNADCVSCHTTTTRAQKLEIESSTDDGRFRAPPGITGFVAREAMARDSWNLRNFGYFNGKPSISTRTLAETIDATHLANDMMARKATSRASVEPVGPGLVCADETAVWNCTVHQVGAEDCFADCELTLP